MNYQRRMQALEWERKLAELKERQSEQWLKDIERFKEKTGFKEPVSDTPVTPDTNSLRGYFR